MTRDELEHAIRAACDVADDDEVWVFGSQAILGQYENAPEALRMSAEVDIAPVNHPARAIDLSLGELSTFHQACGFYVHGVSIEAAVLPQGWERRGEEGMQFQHSWENRTLHRGSRSCREQVGSTCWSPRLSQPVLTR